MKKLQIPLFEYTKILLTLLLCSLSCLLYSQVTANSEKCILISDIHFDPLFQSHDDTILYKKLIETPVNNWTTLFLANPKQNLINNTLLGKDANYALLKSALINMSSELVSPSFIIIAGDFIWHGAKPKDSILKKKTMIYIASLFNYYFPKTKLIPILGNNDTYGEDYQLQNLEYLRDFTDAWSMNLPKESKSEFLYKGYNTCKIGNVNLIILNSSTVSMNSQYKNESDEMLDWLQKKLANNETQNVWIISHIPPGLNGYNNKNMWNIEQQQTFINTVVKYAKKIKFIIAAHTHFNEFKVFYNNQNKPKAFMRLIPSICSNHGNYPSFEIAEINGKDGTLNNEINYVLKLTTSINQEIQNQFIWHKQFTTLDLLYPNKLNATGFSNLITKTKNNKGKDSLSKYIDYYTLGTKIENKNTLNKENLNNYIKADSLKAMK